MSKIPTIKYLMMFLLGIFSMIFTATAFNITPSVPNTIQYIKTIFLTSNGGNTSATGIVLEGSGGTAWFSGEVTLHSLPSAVALGTDASGKIIYSTSGDVYNFISGYVSSGPRGATGEMGPQGITGENGADGFLSTGVLGATPYWNGTSRTITDANIYNLGENVGIGTLSPHAKLQVYGNFIAGSSDNLIQNSSWSSIAGGEKHLIKDTSDSTIAGGFLNKIENSISSFIGGGQYNYMIRTRYSSIIAGSGNTIEGEKVENSTIAGGGNNRIKDTNYSTIAGGVANLLDTSRYSFIGGGINNTITTAKYSSIVGGSGNKIFGDKSEYGTIVGGLSNTLENVQYSTIAGGTENTINGGANSTILGGQKNSINSNYSVAAGYQAQAKHHNVFVRNSDMTNAFESKKNGDFLINVPKTSGVGINTNNPQFTLDVNGTINGETIRGNSIVALSGGTEYPGIDKTIDVSLSGGTTCRLRFTKGLLTDTTCP